MERVEEGLKLGTQSSSDHISTHSSYTMIYSPSRTATDLVESMRKRHAYGATDNIVVDFRAGEHMMGDAFDATTPPRMTVKVLGHQPLGDGGDDQGRQVRLRDAAGGNDGGFHVSRPESGEAGELVLRAGVIQADRQMAWSSPMWVKY